MNWIDRLTEPFAPAWTLRRLRARLALELVSRHYEAAAPGRRTAGWRRASSDPNAAASAGLARLRDVARDLVRNNPYATGALDTIVDHAVGWGITLADQYAITGSQAQQAANRWKAWAETTACDADRRQDFAGLQKLVMRTMAEAGEVLIRRRWRRPEDNLPIPLQLQVLEPDYLDITKDGLTTDTGGRIIQGIEFNPIGRRIAYWMFPEHPGSNLAVGRIGASERISATEVLHVFKPQRPGQVRGISWFAPVILRLKDFDDYEDAALMKQKIAACLAVITTDVDGTAPGLGTVSQPSTGQEIDTLGPGEIINAPAGRDVHVVQPPQISEHADYSRTVLRAIATGLGLSYEDITGDYQGLPFSAARMSRIRHWARVDDWRWRILVPQFLNPVWTWAMAAAGIMGLEGAPAPEWTAPPMPMIEPDVEGLAYQRLLRIGAITWPEMVRERGYSPEQQLDEMRTWNAKFDQAGLILDSDPRRTTQAGNPFTGTGPTTTPPPAGPTMEASRNGHARRDEDVARAFRLLEQALSQRPSEIHVSPPNLTIAEGAIQTHVAAAQAPDVRVEGTTVNVAPPSLTIAEGAVHVEAPTTIADGAVTVTPARPPEITVIRARPSESPRKEPQEDV